MRNRHIFAAASLAAGALALAGCGATSEPEQPEAAAEGADPAPETSETVTVSHKQGEEEVPRNPETVVVFDYGSLDTLHTLGVDVAGVPKGNLPDSLDVFDSEEVAGVGTLFEPDYEAINALDPDLIIIGGRSAAAFPELAKHWTTIDLSVDHMDFLGDVHESTEILGEVFEKQPEAEAALAELDQVVDEVRGLGADAGPGMIVSTSGGEVTVYGADSRFGIIHTVLEVPEAVNEVEALPHGEAISFEMIRDTNPDWLFVNDRDAAIGESGESAEAILDNELVHATTAWEEDQVVYLDAQRWYITMSGVTNAREMFSQIGTALDE